MTEVSGQYLPFRTYSIELGLSESVAHTIVQDDRGYIWVGTGYGLNRFDGVRFTQFYEEDGLAHNSVHSLFQDHEGLIWIGTDLGISVLHGDSLVTPSNVEGLNQFVILNIFQDSAGNYWFGTEGNGVWKLSTEGILTPVHKDLGLDIISVKVINQTNDGTIWIGSREGLVMIDDDQNEATHFTMAHGISDLRIRDIVIDEFERIWIGTRAGLMRYQNGEFLIYNHNQGLNDDRILTITVEATDRIWLGTEGGISRFDGETFVNYGREEGVPALIVYSSIIDREGNMWFGTLGGGITMYVGDYFRSYNIDNGLTNNVVTGFSEVSNGDIWIATYGGGVMIYDGSELTNYNESDGLIDNKVYVIYEDSTGRIWVGTSGGISIYEDDEFRTLPESIFPFTSVRKIYEDPDDGEFWIATYNDGIIRLSDDGYVQYNINSGILHNTVMDIKRDDRGDYWFATYGGVAIYDGEQFRYLTIADGLPSNGVIHIHIDHIGRKWFSTFNGVAMYDGEKMHNLPSSEGMETIAYFVEQDQALDYWIGTNRGLYWIDPEHLIHSTDYESLLSSFRLFNKNQGLIANELNAGASLVASDESIWLGSVEGLSQFFPHNIQKRHAPPGIEFEEILINGNRVHPNNFQLLQHDQNFIEFSFSGLAYEAPDQILYEYRLTGFDEDWQLTSERTIRYPSLDPGSYEFELRAYNADGVKSSHSAEYSFKILQPYYFQWWFLLLILLIIGSLILFYLRYFRIRKQVDIERMRVQIASDLHDDVGSSLTELALQTDFLQAGNVDEEVKSTLRQLGEHSRKIVSSLDDIVWSIDARNDTAGDLTDRMQDYVNQLFANGNILVHYNFDKLRMHEKLPVDVKENVYLIFKEAMNNVVKHSNADEVHVTFSFTGRNYELLIHDNGNQIKHDRKTGQGLRNIKMRAERIGSAIEIYTNGGFTVKATGSIK
ncbi:MAG: two-component regulator propeller domain-containing protein [Balneolaceae bacterium]